MKRKHRLFQAAALVPALVLFGGKARGQQTINYTPGETNNNPITITAATNPVTLSLPGGTATQAGAIGESGVSGEIIISGGGEMILAATNTYSGGTTVHQGTLQVGDGTDPASISGGVDGSNNGITGASTDGGGSLIVSAAARVSGGSASGNPQFGQSAGSGGTGANLLGPSLNNAGSISGGAGQGGGINGVGGKGGEGVIESSATTVTNSGAISGGNGGGGGASGNTGLEATGGGVLINSGSISGGGGTGGLSGTVGSGGTGVFFGGGGTVNNSGTVNGGSPGSNALGGTGPVGAEGLIAKAVVNFSNTGTISGGGGGGGATGGIGVEFDAGGSYTNQGNIDGGGGGGGLGGNGGAGGIGFLAAANLNFTNSGTIAGGGGAGSSFGSAGPGGAGVSFPAGGSLFNLGGGTISGGAGASNDLGVSSSAGAAVVFKAGAGTLSNQGAIDGDVDMDDFTNAVALTSGGTITGNLDINPDPSSTLKLSGTSVQNYSSAVTGTTTFNGELFKTGSGTWKLDQTFDLAQINMSGGTLEFTQGNVGAAAGVVGVTISSSAFINDSGGIKSASSQSVSTTAATAVALNGPSSLANGGSIIGGSGFSNSGGAGGTGAPGVLVSAGGSVTNTGTIHAGNGGSGVSGGNGGDGMDFSNGGSLFNDVTGSISAGPAGAGSPGAPGIGVAFSNGSASLTNKGIINGGVSMAKFANAVKLFTGSTINGNLDIGGSSNATLTLDGAGTQTFSQAVTGTTTFSGSLTKQGAGKWTLDTPLSPVKSASVTDGTLALAAASVLTTSGVSVTGGAALDVGASGLIVQFGSGSDPVGAIVSDVVSGRAGGNWAGPGIDSSAAAGDPSKFAVGVLDASDAKGTAGEVRVNYTLAGDAFLEGSVGFDDLVVVAQNFGRTGEDWAGGNFNYDPSGSVGFTDLVSVAQNFGSTVALASGPGGPAGLSPVWQAAVAATPVPEPGTVGLSVMVVGGLMARRRRR